HDIYQAEDYPFRNVIPIVAPWNKIGRRTIKLDPEKVEAIVFTDIRDSPADIAEPDEKTQAIAKHILDFFEKKSTTRKTYRKIAAAASGYRKSGECGFDRI